MKNSKLKKNNLVTKPNTLNELRPNDMSLQELRFFSIYLSKINPMDERTRVVTFSIADFQAIMGLNSRLKIDDMKQITKHLLQRVVEIPNEHGKEGGYIAFQLFKECEVTKNENDEWIISIDAHDRALPHMFNIHKRFFKYQLWNALRLKSRNQLRMYEMLKACEYRGYKIATVSDIKYFLGIPETEYTRFGDFKTRVLDACQQSLLENTDICFTYEPYGKKGRGGKVFEVKFNIFKNTNYVDPISLERFISMQKTNETGQLIEVDSELSRRDEKIMFLRDAVNNEFSNEEMNVLYDAIINHHPSIFSHDDQCYNLLSRAYNEMVLRGSKGGVKYRFGYVRSILEKG